MKEKEIEDACCQLARQHGIVSVKLEHCGHKGIPDRVFIGAGGRCLFVEFKTPRGKLSYSQKVWAEFLGYSYGVCRSVDEFELLMRAFFFRQ